MKHLYLFGLFFSLPFFCFSQGEWNNWYFGWHAGITFNSGSPVAFQGNPMTETAMVGASVSDSLGNILFYSNGNVIYNRNNVIMSNGLGLLGGYANETQSVIAVPNLTNQNQYFIFTVGRRPDFIGSIIGLHYSVLDMQLEGDWAV